MRNNQEGDQLLIAVQDSENKVTSMVNEMVNTMLKMMSIWGQNHSPSAEHS
jgi:hypothetical protein